MLHLAACTASKTIAGHEVFFLWTFAAFSLYADWQNIKWTESSYIFGSHCDCSQPQLACKSSAQFPAPKMMCEDCPDWADFVQTFLETLKNPLRIILCFVDTHYGCYNEKLIFYWNNSKLKNFDKSGL